MKSPKDVSTFSVTAQWISDHHFLHENSTSHILQQVALARLEKEVVEVFVFVLVWFGSVPVPRVHLFSESKESLFTSEFQSLLPENFSALHYAEIREYRDSCDKIQHNS